MVCASFCLGFLSANRASRCSFDRSVTSLPTFSEGVRKMLNFSVDCGDVTVIVSDFSIFNGGDDIVFARNYSTRLLLNWF